MGLPSVAPQPPAPAARPPICSLQAYGTIAQSLAVVEQLRQQRQANSDLSQRTTSLRLWQAQRFRATYADMLQDAAMGPAALFFLTELYSEQEFSRRDAQFARIAGTLERLFAPSVVQTATLLAKLHALSETLDACMAIQWQAACSAQGAMDVPLYHSLWRALIDAPAYTIARQEQLDATQALGMQLQRHTQVPGLRLMLKLMRAPATAAGLQDLQRFLERGFDTFAQLGTAGKVPQFLATVAQREGAWLARMAA